MPMISPSLAKADMGQANRAPSEECRQARQGEQPIEDHGSIRAQVDICQQATDQNNANRESRPARAVNIRKDLGRVAKLRHGGQGARATVDAGHADGHDGDDNDGVNEVVEAGEAGVLADEHKGRGGHVAAGRAFFAAAEETRVVGADEEANKEETEDVEALRPS